MSRLFVSDLNLGCSSSSESEDGLYDDPDIAAKYRKQRKERKEIKRNAITDLMRLQKIVNGGGMEKGSVAGGGAEGKKAKGREGRTRKYGINETNDNEVRRRKRIVEEAKRRREEEEMKEKRREDRERRRKEKEKEKEKEIEKEKEKEREREREKIESKSRPRPRTTSSTNRTGSPTHKNRINHNLANNPMKKTARRHSSIPSRYVGRTLDSPKAEKNNSSIPLRPEWCNSKGPNRHSKHHNSKHPSMADIGYVLGDLFEADMFGDFQEIRKKKKVTGHVNQPLPAKKPRSTGSVESDDEGSSHPDVPPASGSSATENEGREKAARSRVFESRAERMERERRSRLEANRKALGLDGGGGDKGKIWQKGKEKKKKKEKGDTANKKKENNHDYSAFVEEEMRKFKERAEAERHTARMDDLLLRDYNMSWEGFVRSKGNNCITEKDIPWLPRLGLGGPGGNESWKLVGVSEHADFESKKAALRVHTMRWHPDKFSQKWGNSIREEEKGEIMERVRECCQRLNEIRGRLEVEKDRKS